jgi:uncharacterized YigZ family protein
MPDTYRTAGGEFSFSTRERGSRFVGHAYPVSSEREAGDIVASARREFHDATHVCWACKVGGFERANDDGEPSGSAGRPILGQILSRGLDRVLVIVVRWFGGTKLGVPGLIAAYREAAAGALDGAGEVEKVVEEHLRVEFLYPDMNSVMRVIKDMGAKIVSQSFENQCVMELSVRKSQVASLIERLEKAGAEPRC